MEGCKNKIEWKKYSRVILINKKLFSLTYKSTKFTYK